MANLTTQQIIESLYNIKTAVIINPITNIVGTTPIEIATNDPSRLSIDITNLSGNTIYVVNANNPSSTNGYILNPNGGFITLNFKDDLQKVTNNWYAVSTAANSNILVETTIILQQ